MDNIYYLIVDVIVIKEDMKKTANITLSNIEFS